MGPRVLHALPKSHLWWELLHLEQEAGCIYVHNAGPSWRQLSTLNTELQNNLCRHVHFLTTKLGLVLISYDQSVM